MAENFYYYAAYTAAQSVGFSPAESAEIAQAACCAEHATADNTPPAEKVRSPGITSALQYLPGDGQKTAALANPELLAGGGAALAASLSLVCGPDGSLPRRVMEWARARYQSNAAGPLSVGIALHSLGSAFLHQGFSGISDETVNAVLTVMTAKSVPPPMLQKLLEQSASQPPEMLFQLEPYVPEQPPVSFLGCGQLGALPDCPNQIYTYQSPWRLIPTVLCINPFRFAAAYSGMREALLYIRKETSDPPKLDNCQQMGDCQQLELACFFAQIPSDSALPEAWKRHFSWCHSWPENCAPPTSKTAPIYFNRFSIQLLAFRDFVWNACPALLLGNPPFPAKMSKSETKGG